MALFSYFFSGINIENQKWKEVAGPQHTEPHGTVSEKIRFSSGDLPVKAKRTVSRHLESIKALGLSEPSLQLWLFLIQVFFFCPSPSL